jgi:glycine cleavage system H protein
MLIPEELLYTQEHEWLRLNDDGTVRIGITDYAQDALGDVVFAELPSLGSSFATGQTLAEVESTKSVAEVYAPLEGTVTAANSQLHDHPELINSSPYGEGWFVELRPDQPVDAGAFLDAGAYRALTED